MIWELILFSQQPKNILKRLDMNFDFDIDNLLGVDLTKFLMKKKKVKFIPLDKADETKYPVGRFIQQNMSIILDMITKLKIVNTKDDLILCCRGRGGAIMAELLFSHFQIVKISIVKKVVKGYTV